jgi:hypothetical protein
MITGVHDILSGDRSRLTFGAGGRDAQILCRIVPARSFSPAAERTA